MDPSGRRSQDQKNRGKKRGKTKKRPSYLHVARQITAICHGMDGHGSGSRTPLHEWQIRRKRDAGVVGLKVRRDPRHGSRRKTEEDDS